MTHEFVGVVVDPSITRDTAHDAVAPILAPYEETWNDDAEERDGWWDFWMVGGRWTGEWLPGYDPRTDPLNVDPRPCFICNGTGHRPDIGDMDRQEYIQWCGGCNGCHGKGHQVKWPSDFRPIAEDCLPVQRFLDNAELLSPRRLVLPDSPGLSRDDYAGDHSYDRDNGWDRIVREALAPFAGANIVVVDVHV